MTLEGLRTRVLPEVSGQLVRAGKLPRAFAPRALVRLLSRVSPLVGLQMGAHGVNLVAVLEITLVDLIGVVARAIFLCCIYL